MRNIRSCDLLAGLGLILIVSSSAPASLGEPKLAYGLAISGIAALLMSWFRD